MNVLPVYHNRCRNITIRTYGDKVYTNFVGLNVPEDVIKCHSVTIISVDFLFIFENKYYLQVYLDNCAYKIINTNMVDYLDDNLFESDKWNL